MKIVTDQRGTEQSSSKLEEYAEQSSSKLEEYAEQSSSKLK